MGVRLAMRDPSNVLLFVPAPSMPVSRLPGFLEARKLPMTSGVKEQGDVTPMC